MAGIPVEWCVGAREVGEPRLSPDGTMIGFAVTSDRQARIEVHALDGTAPVRTIDTPAPRVGRSLGGGGWDWSNDGREIVFAAADGNLWAQSLDDRPCRRLTDHGPESVAQAPSTAPGTPLVAYVVDQAEVWAVPIGSDAGPSGDDAFRLDDGSADFCFDPVVMPGGGCVMWQAWNVPDMPWDSSRLEIVDLSDPARPRRRRVQPAGALQQPRALPDGRILAVRDDHGWANLWLDGQPLLEEPVEHAGPTWGLGQRSFAVSPDGGRVAFTRNEHGFGRLCVMDLASGAVQQIARGVHGQLSWAGTRLAALRTGATTPTQIVAYDVDAPAQERPSGSADGVGASTAWRRRTVAIGPASAWSAATLAEPELVVVPVDDGAVVHARFYRADAAPDGTPADRLICWLHGGPTDQWQVTFMPRIAYWRSRGWNVLVPDHRGSTGHGREYQQALRGRWGELDVEDTIAVVRAAHEAGWGCPDRTVLIGSSAGGFTVLNVLVRTRTDEVDELDRLHPDDEVGGDLVQPLAAAGVVAYPVTDLEGLAEQSVRFERHYTDSLVGARHTPAMRERSPVFSAHQIRCPLLVFHGSDDPVVPVEQSRVLVQRMRTAGSAVELIVYDGEGHGFRSAEHQLDEYAHTAAFLRRHVG